MTKAYLSEEIWKKHGSLSKREAKKAVETVFDIIREKLLDGESTQIKGFGSFIVRQKDSRIGQNLQTGGTVEISARKVVVFKASRNLKRQVQK
ncbi:MAG: integration host factor subunit alpha [Candidatus Schekmanbacteria bacterium]|nr:integration host factor subunit alpha [Candidatus Schekmanbacteria bacterium]